MALQTIRYGGGVWKQHEELRLRLEAQVRMYEQELVHWQQQLTDSQDANAALQQQLQTSQSHALMLEELLQARARHAETLRGDLADANQRQADSERRVQQLQSELSDVSSLCAQQQTLLQENVHAITRLELQVSASREEELRLCELLYAAQETSEGREAELTKQTRELRIATRASHSKSRQNDALMKENAALARKLAQLRGANPKVHLAPPPAKPTNAKSSRSPELKAKVQQQQSESNQRGAERDDAETPHRTPYSEPSPKQPTPSGGLLWRELQLMSAKLRAEQRENAQLRDEVEALAVSERALMVRFREAAAARQRAEKKASLQIQTGGVSFGQWASL